MIKEWLAAQTGIDPAKAAACEARWQESLQQWLIGYGLDPQAILQQGLMDWPSGSPQTITLEAIRFQSVCSHHLLPFWGSAMISYVPNGHIISLGAARRAVEALAQRLQMQEQLTAHIADVFQQVLQPQTLYIELKAQHGCQLWRGGDGQITTKVEK